MPSPRSIWRRGDALFWRWAAVSAIFGVMPDSNISDSPLPGLYIVATPIGNLGDIGARAARTLASADVIAAEDTRVTAQLLSHLGLRVPMRSEEHTSELQSLMRLSYAVFCSNKSKK